ncbi:AMP-binding protein, partial [bacterium]|nr:AMP-binding protein [bacterium]
MLQRTIPRLFEDSVAKYADRPYIWEKQNGGYMSFSFRDVRELVSLTAAGLMAIGIKKGDRCALLSEGRCDWIVTELGILYAGATNVPFSVKLEEYEELKFRLSHSECRFCFVSGSQAAKIFKIKRDLPDLEKIFLFDGEPQDSDETTLKDLQELGRKYIEAHEKEFDSLWQSIQESDLANICYTSGTISDPKGVMLTHRNYTANVEQACNMVHIPQDWITLMILPWDHSFGHTAGIYSFMAKGASIAAIEWGKTHLETIRNIPVNIKEIQPHIIYSVPALSQNFRKGIERGIRQKGKWPERLFRMALKTAYKYNGLGINKGRGARKILKPLVFFYEKVLFSRIRSSFGGRLNYFIGGAAVLDCEMQRFFYALGIPIYQGYGLTEASPVISANTPESHKLGTSGKPLPDLELRIIDDNGQDLPQVETGQITVKGGNIMKGYWKNEQATQKALQNGWLYTGDLGYIDEDGFLVVLGRKKSLLIGDDGKKYSPEGIEEAIINNSRYIEQVMLYNSQSPYTVALIYP